MLVRKIDGYKKECEGLHGEGCCSMHFYNIDTYVYGYKGYISYENLYDMPLSTVLGYTCQDESNWASLAINVYVKCPLCGNIETVWFDRLFPTKEVDTSRTLRDLLDSGDVTLTHNLEMDFYGTEFVYGPEVEII